MISETKIVLETEMPRGAGMLKKLPEGSSVGAKTSETRELSQHRPRDI
jgi:hypothetical protein